MSPRSSLDLFRSECAAPFPRGPEIGGEKGEFADPIQAFRRLLAEMMTISSQLMRQRLLCQFCTRIGAYTQPTCSEPPLNGKFNATGFELSRRQCSSSTTSI